MTWAAPQLTCMFIVPEGLGLSRIAWPLSPPLVTTAGCSCVMATRRRRGEDGISFEHLGPCSDPERHRHCPGLWRGEFTLRYGEDRRRERRKVSGRTKAAVVDKLRELRGQLDHGIVPKTGYANYTVRQAAQDWLANGLDGRSTKMIKKNENVLEPILKIIGAGSFTAHAGRRMTRETPGRLGPPVGQALRARRWPRCGCRSGSARRRGRRAGAGGGAEDEDDAVAARQPSCGVGGCPGGELVM